MITIILLILAGLVLLSGVLGRVPGIGPSLERATGWLSAFDVVIGVVALVLGFLELLSVVGILLILAGFVLAASALRAIPSVGPSLGRLGDALAQFRVILGVIVLGVGLLYLFQFIFGSVNFYQLR